MLGFGNTSRLFLLITLDPEVTKKQVWIGILNKYARIFCIKGLEKVGAVFSPTNDTPAVVVVCRVSVSSRVVMRLTVCLRLNPQH